MSKEYMNTNTTDELCEKLWIGLVTTMTKFYVENGVPLIRNSDIKQNNISKDLIKLDREFANLHSSRTVKTGDVVTVHTGDVGVSSVIPKELNGAHGFATINSRLKKEIILPEYYCWFLNSDIFKQQVYQVITGDGRNNLNLNDFINLNVYYPLIPIQKSIIEYLNTTASIIEKTQAAIAKYKAIKLGMLHDLFTRGIDTKTGKLRPSYQDSPELYKPSELGWIPKEWEVLVLEETCEILDHLRVPVNGEQRQILKGEIPYYGANGIQGYINDYIFNEDLILIAEDGGNFEEYDTRPIAYRITGKSWVNNHAHILKAKSDFCQDFIFYSLVHKNIIRFIAGGTRSKLNKSELIKIPIALPHNIIEQNIIALKLNGIENEIQSEMDYLQKLQQIKSGLMTDLLSGKKIITVN